MALPKKLISLAISEISGVDAPANELDGWMVAKARGERPTAEDVALVKSILSPEERATVAVLRHRETLVEGDHAAVEAVRRAAGDDDLAVSVIRTFFERTLGAAHKLAARRGFPPPGPRAASSSTDAAEATRKAVRAALRSDTGTRIF